MSKFLKFIVNLFLILAIVVTAGIIIPPLLGVNTTIVDTASMDTNLPLGSVTYSRDKAVKDLAAGDEILKESGSATYAYIIQEGDASTGEFTVVSATELDASSESIILRNSVSEVVLTIPYIGFVVVAMQSLEGRIIIALVILFIIILFILSELWKKRDDDDDDDDDDYPSPSGNQGNLQAASADMPADADKRFKAEEENVSGYSENVTDYRGYGTVSRDTASIAAAMSELQAINGKSQMTAAEEWNEAELGRKAAEEGNRAELSRKAAEEGNRAEFSRQAAEERDTAEFNRPVSAPPDDVRVYDRSAEAYTAPASEEEALGDTKVFQGSMSGQLGNAQSVPGIEAAHESSLNGTKTEYRQATYTAPAEAAVRQEPAPQSEDAISEALIAETEKAAAAWNNTDVEGASSAEPKSLWSWTDEPFENELEGDSWNLPAGHPTDTAEYPERFALVERMTRQEILEQAKSGGSDPKVQRDDVTGIDIIDYSELL